MEALSFGDIRRQVYLHSYLERQWKLAWHGKDPLLNWCELDVNSKKYNTFQTIIN